MQLDNDMFINQKLYPDAKKIFGLTLDPISVVKDSCLFVLDTNALLIPYSTSSESLVEIKRVLTLLKDTKKIVVPGQVAREFANSRPEKLKQIYQQLSKKRDGIQPFTVGKYPILEELEEFKNANAIEKEINEKVQQYREAINSLSARVRSWLWDDPISDLYKIIFTDEVIIDPTIDEQAIKTDLAYRYKHKIPPGYKDGNKGDNGIGDLLIWRTILEVARSGNSIIFVSGDEKNDWFYQSDKQALYPRFELISEFQHESPGKSFHIIRLSELLKLFGATLDVVEEVQLEEIGHSSQSKNLSFIAEKAVVEWIINSIRAKEIRREFLGLDFVVIGNDDKITGVEVISFYEKVGTFQILDRVERRVADTVENAKRNDIPQLKIFIVSEINDFRLGVIKEKMGDRYSNSVEIQFIYGYLDVRDQFVRLG